MKILSSGVHQQDKCLQPLLNVKNLFLSSQVSGNGVAQKDNFVSQSHGVNSSGYKNFDNKRCQVCTVNIENCPSVDVSHLERMQLNRLEIS